MDYNSRFDLTVIILMSAICIAAGSAMINDLGEDAIAWTFLYSGLASLAALTPLLFLAQHRAKKSPVYRLIFGALLAIIGPGSLLFSLAFPGLVEAFRSPLATGLVLISLMFLAFQISLTHHRFAKCWSENHVRILEQVYNPKLSVIDLDRIGRLLKLEAGLHFSSLPRLLQVAIFILIPAMALVSVCLKDDFPEIGAGLWASLWLSALFIILQLIFFNLALATKLRKIEIRSAMNLGYMDHQEIVHMRAPERRKKK